MQGTTLWFFGLLSLAVASLLVGCWWARHSRYHGWLMVAVSLIAVGLCTWLGHKPEVATHIFSIASLQYLEGTAAVPFFMLIMGAGWAQARKWRQRAFVSVGVLIGLLFFFQSASWMVRTAPEHLTGEQQPLSYVVMQSQDYSCVPAASATALNLMGFKSSEAQMGKYTHTYPGVGSTPIRAANGLAKRLDGSGVSVRIVKADIDQLALTPCPILLTVKFDQTVSFNHMIVILKTTPEGAYVADPTDGQFFMPWQAMKEAMAGPAIVFDRSATRQALLSPDRLLN